MQIIAEQNTTRQSPRKVRLVANAVRKLPLEKALQQLAVMERRASLVVAKVLRQALANAKHNHRLEANQVELKNIIVNVGPTYKRWRAASRGRAHSIYKRTSHIRVILETKAEKTKTETKKVEPKAEKAVKPAVKKAEPVKKTAKPSKKGAQKAK